MDNNENSQDVSHELLISESRYIDIEKYRRKYGRRIPKDCVKYYENKIPIDIDLNSNIENSNMQSISVYDNVSSRPNYVDIIMKFTPFGFYETFENNPKFERPHLTCCYKIYNVKKTNYNRQFGIIQTSKKFLEREFDEMLTYVDFLSNLLYNEDEVLVSDGEIFSSGIYEIQANQSPHEIIEIEYNDFHMITPDFDHGYLQALKRHEQFFVYLVMRSMRNNGEWKYDMLHTFDWFFYLEWYRENLAEGNKFEYKFGINIHKENRILPEINSAHRCNQEQFEHGINLRNGLFKIFDYPKIIINSIDKAIFSENVKNEIIKRNQKEFDELQSQTLVL